MVAAAPPIAELARATHEHELVGKFAMVCGDLASGFAAPPGSRAQIQAHRRAWIAVREVDRKVTAARFGRRVPAELVARAQRAIDRADVMISALLPS